MVMLHDIVVDHESRFICLASFFAIYEVDT